MIIFEIEKFERKKNTSKLIWSGGTDSPSVVPTDKYNWGLHDRRKIQSSMEISLTLIDVLETKQPKRHPIEIEEAIEMLMEIKYFLRSSIAIGCFCLLSNS